MELKKMLIGLEGIKAKGNVDIDIKGIESNSRKVEEGYMFVAIKGFSENGHEYVESAIKQGAVAVILQEDCINAQFIKQVPEGITIVVAKDTRYALAICSCNFYGNPSRKF